MAASWQTGVAIVRPLLPTDLPKLATLSRAVHRRDGYPPHLPEDEVPGYIASDDALMAWVAVDETIDDTTVAGHVALLPAEASDGIDLAATRLGRANADFGVIARLIVDPDLRRTGVGRHLLDRATAECRRRGLVPILDIVDRSDPAIGLYERSGWRRLGAVELELADGSDLRLLVFVAPDPSDDSSPRRQRSDADDHGRDRAQPPYLSCRP
jgi:ribosomal protein S18 acetylase RimI-like enzyme